MELSLKFNILLIFRRKTVIEKKLLLKLKMKKRDVYYRIKK